MEVCDWLLRNFNNGKVVTLQIKWIKKCARKWRRKLFAFLFEVTLAFGKMCQIKLKDC